MARTELGELFLVFLVVFLGLYYVRVRGSGDTTGESFGFSLNLTTLCFVTTTQVELLVGCVVRRLLKRFI